MTLDDESVDDGFKLVHGFVSAKWERIAAGQNVSHVVVLEPLGYGYVNMSSALLSYKSGDDVITSETSTPPTLIVFEGNAYARLFQPHKFEWFVFVVLALAAIFVPYSSWSASAAKFAVAPSSKKNK